MPTPEKDNDLAPETLVPADPKLERPTPEDEGNYALQDWDAIVTGTLVPGSVSPDALDEDVDPDLAELPEEDDDNPYQHSDEALPEDKEEAALRRNPSKEGGLFDEV